MIMYKYLKQETKQNFQGKGQEAGPPNNIPFPLYEQPTAPLFKAKMSWQNTQVWESKGA